MLTKIKSKKLVLIVAAALFVAGGIIASVTALSQQVKDPVAKEPAGPAPSRVIASRKRQIPALNATTANARAAVSDFMRIAGDAGADQREEIRRNITAARDNRQVVDALCEEAFQAQKEDHSRALLALSLLGEMRSASAADCLSRFLKIPFPTTGTVVDGEIIEQTALATLQAKAIDGLAYLNGKDTNQIVLNAVREHPSIIVRAEAIEAYQWNNRGQAAVARRTLTQFVRKGEEIYIDRVRRETGEKSDTFNRKVDTFLRAHPEANIPGLEKEKEQPKPKDEKPARIPEPPKF
jgi:hypothetical protein